MQTTLEPGCDGVTLDHRFVECAQQNGMYDAAVAAHGNNPVYVVAIVNPIVLWLVAGYERAMGNAMWPNTNVAESLPGLMCKGTDTVCALQHLLQRCQ